METSNRHKKPEIVVTPEMIEAGEDTILGVVGGADLGGFFSAPDLAKKVYEAMEHLRRSERGELR